MNIPLLLLFFWWPGHRCQADFDRPAFYSVLRIGKLADVGGQLEKTEMLTGADREAYSGVLLMRKAGLLKKPKDKLEAFRHGRIRLETAIAASPEKTEYHFLRLIIQEHAPGVTKYHEQLEADRAIILQHFSQLPAYLQDAIRDYSIHSTVIHPGDL